MIFHIRQADASGDARGPGAGRQQHGLGYAITAAISQRCAGAQPVRLQRECIGVVADFIADCIVKPDGALPVIAFPGAVAGEGLDVGVVAINKIAGGQVLAGVCLHVCVLSIQSGGTRSRVGTTEANADFEKFRLGRRRDADEDIF